MTKSIRMVFVVFVALVALGVHTFAATKTATTSGNWSTSGTWTPAGAPAAGDVVIINAGVTVTVDVNTANVNDITINAGGVLQGDGTGKILNYGRGGGEDMTNNGTLDAAGAHAMTIFFSRNSQWGGTGVYNTSFVNISNRTWTFTAGVTMNVNISGAPDPLSGTGTITPSTTLTFTYNGTSAQNITSNANFNFHSIAITNSAGVTLQKNLTAANLTGNLSITGGGVLKTSNGTTAFSITGSAPNTLTIGAGSTLNLGSTAAAASAFPTGFTTYALNEGSTVEYANSSSATQAISLVPTYGNVTLLGTGAKSVATGTLTLLGNWTNNSTGTLTFTAPSTVAFSAAASGSRSITGSTATAFNNLTVNNAAGVNLSLTTTVNGTLTLGANKIITGANTLVIGSAGSVSRTSGYVNGFLRKTAAVGSPSITFEIGDASTYAPVNLAFASVSVAGTVTASTTPGDHPNIVTSRVNAAKDANRYWTLTNGGVTFTSYTGTYNFVAGDLDAGAATGSFIVDNFVSPTWFATTVGTRTATSTQASGITRFGDFAVGEAKTITITATAGANGTVTPAGTTVVAYNGSQGYTISANTGYHIVDVLVDGVSVGAVGSYTFSNVLQNHTISASFAIDTFSITASSGANGSISPTGVVSVNYGSNQLFTMTPATGYHVADVLVDGVSVGAVSTYTFTTVTANHTIAVSFAINVYTITASAGANGTISPSGPVSVNYGLSQSFTITPDASYHVADVLVDGVSVGPVTNYDFTTVTANHTINASFAIDTYFIVATAGPHGAISPSDTLVVNEGTNLSFTITPSVGYHVVDVVVDGASAGAVTTYALTNITEDHTIAASFAIDTLTVTASSGANGTVTPAGVTPVLYGGNASYTITASTGYHVADVLIDGVSIGAVTSHNFTAVTTNHTIAASFAIDTLTVTASSGANGTVSPSGVTLVLYGGNQSYTMSPSTGYHVADVLVDGVSIGAVTSHDFTSVTANHTIAASFAIDTFTVTATAGANGTISPLGVTAVIYGGSQSYTITPSTGYHVADVLVDGVSVGAVSSHDFTAVTANHTIAASFAIDTFTITASAGANGSISPSGSVSVNYGANQSFAITPSTGYHVADVLVDGVSIGAVTSHDFTAVTTPHTIAASFAIDTFTITPSAGANGSISPPGPVSVNYGASQLFTITPSTGYHVADVLVDGVSIGAVSSHNFTTVTANHTLAASFAIDTFTVTASAGANGTISPPGATPVLYGGSQSYTITPDVGYHVSDVVADGVSVGAVSSYDFTNVTANHTLVASFTITGYTITALAGANGTISPSGPVPVNHGDNQSFTITPATGYHVADVLVDRVSVGAVTSHDFNNVTANHTITASFAIDVHTITATAGANGSISPSGNVSVNHGDSLAFTITPDVGYFIADVQVDTLSVGAVASYTFTNVTANHTITATFAIQTYTIAASAGPNGSISPSGNVPVNHGANQSFTITPSTGHHVADVLVDGVSVGAVTSHGFNNVTASHTIVASFAIDTLTVTATSAANGTVTPAGVTPVLYGGNQSYTITPDVGYFIADVHVDTASVGAVASYTFTNVTANHTITATFAIQTYTIAASAGANGAISPSGNVSVNHGANQSFTMTPSTGYHVADVLVDGVSIGAVTSHGFNNVTANHTIVVGFAIDTLTVTATSGANGTITPAGVTPVLYGGNQSYTITPDVGYFIADVHVDTVSVGAVTSYTFTNVTANHTITATFAIQTYIIAASAGSNGAISPSGNVPVNHGGSQLFTITPDVGYLIADVHVDTVSVGAVTSYTFTNVTANHTITATFAIQTYTIAASAGPNGAISPSGNVLVNHGGSQSFTITPTTGYHVADVLVDGVSIGAATSHGFNNVTAGHTIAASFAIDTLTVTATSGANGTVTPAGVTPVLYGGNRSYTITPDVGYLIADVHVDTVSVGAVTSYTFTNVTANHTITATFAIQTYTIAASAGSNGAISPSGNVPVNHGGSQLFTITPDVGYLIADVHIDTVSVGAVTSYTFTNVTANHTITATFAIQTYTIAASAGSNGAISPSGNVPVNHGANQSFTITPRAGYFIADVHVDTVSVGAVASYTFTNVTANHTIAATFAIKTYTLHASAGPNGSIAPSGDIAVNHGDSRTFTVTADTGYFIADVHVDSVSVGAVASYTFNSVDSSHTIRAFFAIRTFTINATAGANGSITPSGAMNVNYNASQLFTITPDAGYFIADVHVDTLSVGAVTSYTFTNVTANHSISATFGALNRPPSAVRLFSPAAEDSVPGTTTPVTFVWHPSSDADAGDTLRYTLHVWGAGLDTLRAGLTDTSAVLNLTAKLQVGPKYAWTVQVSDGHVTVASPDTFSFSVYLVTGLSDLASRIPKEYALYQNYPNPFNPTTRLQFDIPQLSTVTLTVYNLVGSEVALLIDQQEMDPGVKQAYFDASKLASGIYFYRIAAEGANGRKFESVRKMIVIK